MLPWIYKQSNNQTNKIKTIKTLITQIERKGESNRMKLGFQKEVGTAHIRKLAEGVGVHLYPQTHQRSYHRRGRRHFLSSLSPSLSLLGQWLWLLRSWLFYFINSEELLVMFADSQRGNYKGTPQTPTAGSPTHTALGPKRLELGCAVR